MSSEHVLVPVPTQFLGHVYAFIGVLEAGPRFSERMVEFMEAPAKARAAEKAAAEQAEDDQGVTLGEPEPEADEEPDDPTARLSDYLEIATEGKVDRLWEALNTLGSQDQAKLLVLFDRLCFGTTPAAELDDIDGDYGAVTWKRVKRLATACSRKGVRTPVRHSTKQGTTYVFFTGVRNGLDA